jgi:hypothetical protein
MTAVTVPKSIALKKYRIPFMLIAMVNLLAGMAAGLVRIGWRLDVHGLAASHGAIMVGGFLGTLIALEKLIPLKTKILYAIPIVSGGSLIAFCLGLPQEAVLMITIASLGLSVVFAFYYAKHRELQFLIMFAGALCWLTGNVFLYSENFYPLSFPLWVGFILLIIVGERIEITKFLPVTMKQKGILFALLALYVGSSLVSFHGIGSIVSGIALICISIWLLQYDLIRVSITKAGLTKYVAVALLCGYLALLICGVFFITMQGSIMSYDVLVHTFFLGFVFSMIFAHGPIILPGVLGISAKPFHRIFYLWLILLQISWLTRAFADSALHFYLRQISGALSVMAILGYFISLIVVTIRNLRGKAI